MRNAEGRWLNLPSLGLSLRVLFTGYILVAGLGLMMAGGQILLTHGKADGKFGLSVDDVVYSYYGNRGNSKLESKLNGSMKDKAPEAVRADLIRWARDGANKEQYESKIQGEVLQYCSTCHGVIPGLPSFNSYEELHEVARIDKGITVDSLTRVSHIHLFGISFIFFFVGLIFSLAVGVPKWLKELSIALPFAFLIIDVFSWWLTKWFPAAAWLTIIGGIGYSLASTFMLFTCLYQMWILPRNGKEYKINAWTDD